ncbi:unnamed protein product [Acanthoscelides obtectus]|uniref:Uncharacterized protein n=1 Tax=Acanthoscelides obtectus TaxID=200917 RepID=A0A9P0LJ92_ACAOB|nr:unnamed protein product [Acanthoscelides obtectus]CAK1641470.1 hypothetical protein AOBTE_LOCUS12426 [Acanthoscelides obtectus]
MPTIGFPDNELKSTFENLLVRANRCINSEGD